MAKRGRPAKARLPIVEKAKNPPCPHCKSTDGGKVANTYPNGNRRKICHSCGWPFMEIASK